MLQTIAAVVLRPRGIRVCICAATLVMAFGCQNIMWRGQNADNESTKLVDNPDPKGPKYIGDSTSVWGMNVAKVEGIALVTQLDDTGSDPPPSWQRDRLMKEMQTHNVKNAAKILASGSTSMAIVAANLPPGIRKGEQFDVFVTTMPNSETTSLRGGFVMQTWLRAKVVLGGRPRDGHDAATVKGRIQVKSLFEPGDDPSAENTGYILGGGVAQEDRPLGLAVRDDFATTLKTAVSVCRAINSRFTTYDESGKVNVATAKNNRRIELVVPEEYRHNIGRYVRVIVNIAYQETPEQRLQRMEQLERELNEPALAQPAALRLEAIGREAVPALKRALQNEDTEVRFYAAEALAYLDEPEGIDVLKQAAEKLPDFRWHALTALTSSEELNAGSALSDLLHTDNAECRYGAFRAMLARSPQDPMMAGDWLPGEFFLHVVPSTGPTMVHFSMQNRAEIVVFGGQVPVSENFIYIENGLTIQAKSGDTVELIKYLPGEGETKQKCKNSVAEVIRAMAQLGCRYETMLAMCKDSQKAQTLNCRMVINRVAKPERLYAREGSPEELDPLLGDAGDRPDSESVELEASSENQPESDPPKKGVFATMKGWFNSK